jgi:hypothetical protein
MVYEQYPEYCYPPNATISDRVERYLEILQHETIKRSLIKADIIHTMPGIEDVNKYERQV